MSNAIQWINLSDLLQFCISNKAISHETLYDTFLPWPFKKCLTGVEQFLFYKIRTLKINKPSVSLISCLCRHNNNNPCFSYMLYFSSMAHTESLHALLFKVSLLIRILRSHSSFLIYLFLCHWNTEKASLLPGTIKANNIFLLLLKFLCSENAHTRKAYATLHLEIQLNI